MSEPQSPEPLWLRWARELHSVAQSGLTYSENPYDLERYHDVRRVGAEIFSQHAGVAPERVLDLFDRDPGYVTPKVDVRGVVFREGKVLLVRELLDGGRWTLPGGWADVNETPSSACCREVWEESGFEVRATKLMAVLDRSLHGAGNYPFTIYKMFFLCEIVGGEATESHETSGAEFFGEHELPELSSPRTSPTQLALAFAHLRDPHRPADFD